MITSLAIMLAAAQPHDMPTRSDLNAIRAEVAEECAALDTYDIDIKGQEDHWQDCRLDNAGDCEDHAIAFTHIFRVRYPSLADRASIYFTWMRDQRTGYFFDPYTGKGLNPHAIAIVSLPTGVFVYDINETAVYQFDEVRQKYHGTRKTKIRGTRAVFSGRAGAEK